MSRTSNSHKILSKNCEVVAVDPFDSIASSNHCSCISCFKVKPALKKIYNSIQSTKMYQFATQRGITLQKMLLLNPSANPTQTFMKTIGKAVEIAFQNSLQEKNIFQQTLDTYKQNPHPQTPPASMFHDGLQSSL